MALYLDEEMVGSDPNTIAYPHLLLCMGVTVVMSDASLVGAHVTNGTTEANVLAELAQQIGQKAPATMDQLYVVGNYNIHQGQQGMTVAQKANALGFHGKAYLFDTRQIKPKDGTYVEVISNGAGQKCTITYKRDEKARGLYDRPIGGGAAVAKYCPNPKRAGGVTFPAGVRQEPAITVGLTGPIHKLHTASFGLQLKSYDIP